VINPDAESEIIVAVGKAIVEIDPVVMTLFAIRARWNVDTGAPTPTTVIPCFDHVKQLERYDVV
jgi:hypothetical protein